MGRGSEGEDESGSKAGNSEGGGLLTPATVGTGTGTGTGSAGLLRGEFLLSDMFSIGKNKTRSGGRWGLQDFAIRSNKRRHSRLTSARMRRRIKGIASSYTL